MEHQDQRRKGLEELEREYRDLCFCALSGLMACMELSVKPDHELYEPESEEIIMDIFNGVRGSHDVMTDKFLQFFSER